MSSDPTGRVERLLARVAQGDGRAADELIAVTYGQLCVAASYRLRRRFPPLENLQETGDVLHRMLLRFRDCLISAKPPSADDYYQLAAAMIVHTLIDVSRHYAAKPAHGGAEFIDSWRCAGADEAAEIAMWAEFHEAVEALPPEELALFRLLYSEGMSQREAAVALGVSQASVRRRWIVIRATLGRYLPDES